MADPYYRYSAAADRENVARSNFPSTFPGYRSSEAPPFPSLHMGSNEMNLFQPGAYGSDDFAGIGGRPEPVFSGVSAYPSAVEDPILLNQRRDVSLGISPPGIRDRDISSERERPSPLTTADGFPHQARESNILFVDGLPTDCTRREVGHLFRPFIGFEDIKVVHKVPIRSEDKAMVLCFVEFVDSKCAVTAMEALQGYKFDDKKPDSPALRIQFAHFPFRPPSDLEGQQIGIPH